MTPEIMEEIAEAKRELRMQHRIVARLESLLSMQQLPLFVEEGSDAPPRD